MILYKYVPYEAGMKILENNSIGFSQPEHFNDPFEVEAAYPSSDEVNPVNTLLNRIQTEAKKSIWKKNTGILSLTRQPLNALMWAHYGDEHKGIVIGIDSSIEQFTCEESNLVPIQYGSVIYTDLKPNYPFLSQPKEPMEVGGTFDFSKGQLERLQRMFLYKPGCWSYEEEVRVVKCLKGVELGKPIKSGSFNILEVNDRPLYLLDLPENAIREVYFGVRSEAMLPQNALELVEKIHSTRPEVTVYGCGIGNESWSLNRFDLEKKACQVLKR
ncbi:MAG: DUF2971 domain-containing protein [Neptuniibacter sp.]